MPDERPDADRALQPLLAIVDALARELDPARELRAEPKSWIERDLGIGSLARR